MLDEDLSNLESAIAQVIDRLQAAEAANDRLRQDVRRLREVLEELEKDNRELWEKIGRFREDRAEIRARLKRVRDWLAV